jgi:hypothetical protein
LLGVVVCSCLFVAAAAAAGKPTAGVHTTKSAAVKTVRKTWPPETIAGKIMMVDPAKKLVVVRANGASFDMLVTPSTRIRSGDHRLTLKDLDQDKQKGVSVRFIPERAGDIARSIDVTG